MKPILPLSPAPACVRSSLPRPGRALRRVAGLTLTGLLVAASAARAQGDSPPAPLFRAAGASAGEALAPGSAGFVRQQLAGVRPEGRVTPLDRASFAAVGTARAGQHVLLPLASDESQEAVVNLVRAEADGCQRVSGTLFEAAPGSFAFNVRGAEVSGFILRPGQGVAFRVETAADGGLLLRELPLNEVVCAGIPRKPEDPGARPVAVAADDAPQEAVPLLNGRPGAVAQLYLDFDGEVVTDPAWNGGNTINAASYNLSAATISAIFDRVKEDYWPFNVNVTTDVAKYNAAPVGRRMRCIITPTNTAAPGSGGVAYLNSFARAGGAFSNTIPCWVFNSDVVGISEAVSHELGHTFGLRHDGREIPGTGHEEYFRGQGSGATGWCPIMGAGYYKPVVQWSRGEYQYANNQEDDVAIIANAANGIGYVTDEAGNTRAAAAYLAVNGGSVAQSGVITPNGDVDYFSFSMGAGTLTLNAASASASPDLDVALEVQNAAGAVVLAANPAGALNAGVSGALPAGTYYLKVSGSGAADPLTTGYSAYGSLGSYNLSGTVPASRGSGVKNDLNGDGRPDLLWENDGSGALVAWFMNGATLTSQTVLDPVGQVDPAWKVRGTGDFNGDGWPDVVWENDNTGDLVVWQMNGTHAVGQIGFSPYNRVDPAWKIMAVADFNGDKKPDLVWENEQTGDLVLWLLDGVNLVSQSAFTPYPRVDPSWKVMGAGDFNGDGKADLVWENADSGSLVLWALNGPTLLSQTTFSPYPQVDPSWKIRSVADFNGDGKPDLIWENDGSGALVVWYLNGVSLLSQSVLDPIGQVDPSWKIRGR